MFLDETFTFGLAFTVHSGELVKRKGNSKPAVQEILVLRESGHISGASPEYFPTPKSSKHSTTGYMYLLQLKIYKDASCYTHG